MYEKTERELRKFLKIWKANYQETRVTDTLQSVKKYRGELLSTWYVTPSSVLYLYATMKGFVILYTSSSEVDLYKVTPKELIRDYPDLIHNWIAPDEEKHRHYEPLLIDKEVMDQC